MIYKASDIVTRVRYTLMDAGAKAFTDPELIAWLNDGRATMYQRRPDIFEDTAEFTCVAGARQTLPNGSTRLFSVDYNTSHKNKRQITLTTDEVLARFRPMWRMQKQVGEILHYTYSEADGASFDVFPPALVGTKVEISYAKRPDVASASTDLTAEGEIAVAYVDYILARAFYKEADTAPAFIERANNHMNLFNAAIGGDAQTKLVLSPNAQREGGTPPEARA